MSHSANFQIEMEMQRRMQRMAAARDFTRALLERCQGALRGMLRDQLNAYMPTEFALAEAEVANVQALLESDPEAASARSQALAPMVLGMPTLAREVRQAAEVAFKDRVQALREEKDRVRDDLESAWRTALSGWKDALARDLAHAELGELRRRMQSADATLVPQGLTRELEALRQSAEVRARDVRAAKAEATRAETQREVAEATLSVLSEVAKDSPAIVATARAALGEATVLQPEQFAQRLVEVTNKAEAEVVDERVRREVAIAVTRSLRDSGFLVDSPWRRVEGGRDEVVIRARKPAGHQAEFLVTLTGDLTYKFDNYQGAACKKDIGAVLPKLQEVYGVRLSDRRVIWENPDDLGRTARQTPSGGQEDTHGR